MKVIDLLNKIANGEEVPEKFKYINTEYFRRLTDYNMNYYSDEKSNLFIESICNANELNKEIEIIEEDKKIEKLENRIDTTFENYNYSERMRLTEIVNKINEIIDYLNNKENK